MEAIECGFIKADTVFIDSTHVKANANKNKYVRKMARHRAHKYKRDLLIEINEDREEHGKKPFKNDDVDDNSSNNGNSTEQKEIKESTTDPESGLFHKGETERCFTYSASQACDRNNFVLDVTTAPGNVHDSQTFSSIFNDVIDMFTQIKAIVVDAGYKTPGICREIIQANKLPVMPYKRPMTKDGYFRKYEYVCICPGIQKRYSSMPWVLLANAVYPKQKLHKNSNTSYLGTICRNRRGYQAHDHGKQLYKKRSETIERVFADAKEKHGMRYTRYRGLGKIQHYLTLLFACMNLKKLAM